MQALTTFQANEPGIAGFFIQSTLPCITQAVSNVRSAINELEGAFLLLEPASMDEAIIGLAYGFGKEPVVCYDRAKVIEILMRDGMNEEEAEEFFSFNIEGAYLGDATPMFMPTASDLVKGVG